MGGYCYSFKVSGWVVGSWDWGVMIGFRLRMGFGVFSGVLFVVWIWM